MLDSETDTPASDPGLPEAPTSHMRVRWKPSSGEADPWPSTAYPSPGSTFSPGNTCSIVAWGLKNVHAGREVQEMFRSKELGITEMGSGQGRTSVQQWLQVGGYILYSEVPISSFFPTAPLSGWSDTLTHHEVRQTGRVGLVRKPWTLE